jgi:two-component system, sensor histidine kinase
MNQEQSVDLAILKGIRILLAEDSDMNRLVTATTLNHYGAIVYEAVNGRQAVETLNNNPCDMVLMDVQMPVMDGREATRIIRSRNHSTLPIVALTANVVKDETDKCFAAGMDDYIAKPYEEEDLVKLIGKWLGKDLPFAHLGIGCCNSLYSLEKLEYTGRSQPDFVQKMIQLFIVQVPAGIREIKTAYAAGEFSVVGATAHRITPILNNFCIAALKEEMEEIQAMAAEKKCSPRLERLIRKLELITTQIVTDLKN